MEKENVKYPISIALLLAAGGLVLIFFSVDFGTSFADFWLAKRGGADTGLYHIVIKSYIDSFLVAGGIIFGVSLLTAILIRLNIRSPRAK
ncbi:hypothetical protein J7E71_10115 [Mesobacillus foraminis]|uniref:hypothetical protein n=1 Tax=Mesobacillus foraminis TaxID=279826 RepID=UPI001BE56C6D|nr:hypothetical protein [Mesobacillus foraminis]MBT2756308.1 hypothetical protein [Mesobacillus foraminis]